MFMSEYKYRIKKLTRHYSGGDNITYVAQVKRGFFRPWENILSGQADKTSPDFLEESYKWHSDYADQSICLAVIENHKKKPRKKQSIKTWRV